MVLNKDDRLDPDDETENFFEFSQSICLTVTETPYDTPYVGWYPKFLSILVDLDITLPIWDRKWYGPYPRIFDQVEELKWY